LSAARAVLCAPTPEDKPRPPSNRGFAAMTPARAGVENYLTENLSVPEKSHAYGKYFTFDSKYSG
jgi:hypothetical protein